MTITINYQGKISNLALLALEAAERQISIPEDIRKEVEKAAYELKESGLDVDIKCIYEYEPKTGVATSTTWLPFLDNYIQVKFPLQSLLCLGKNFLLEFLKEQKLEQEKEVRFLVDFLEIDLEKFYRDLQEIVEKRE
jgi:hypothetical protein